MRPAEERANDPNLSAAERQRAANELARPTQPSHDVPARQEIVAAPARGDGTLGDVGRAMLAIARRGYRAVVPGAPPMGGSDAEDVSTMSRAARFLAGTGRKEEDVPEFGTQVTGNAYDDAHWHGGPLSGALNALPQPARAWLDTEGRLARISVGWFLNANEDDRAEIIRNNVPSAQFRRDRFGNIQVRMRPEHEWAYLNTPGVSFEDGLTTAQTLERFAPAARVSSAAATLGGRVTAAGLTSAATEYGSQSADDLVGGPQGADAGDVAMAGVFGAGGQAVFDTAAAAYQVAKPWLQRAGIIGERPAPPPSGRSADATYGEPQRDFAAERAAIDERAQAERVRLDTQTFNERVPRAADINANNANPENAARLTPGQERILEDHTRRLQRVEQERLAAHARLDNAEHGLDLSPPERLHELAMQEFHGHRPVFVATPNGVQRVANVFEEGFITETGEHVPSAGMIAAQTEDGLLFQRPTPRPRSISPQPPAAEPSPTAQPSASDIYAESDRFGIPVSRGEAANDVVQRTAEFDMLHGVKGAGAQRRAAAFQDQRAAAIERAGRNLATRNQDSLTTNIDDAGQVVQNQIRDRWHALTRNINDAYKQAMTALSGVQVQSAESLMEGVQRRLRFGDGPLEAPDYGQIPIGGYDSDLIMNVTKSRPATALRLVRDMQGEIITRLNMTTSPKIRFSDVERVRQRLLTIQEQAHAAQDADAHAVDLIVLGFDDWLNVELGQVRQRVRITTPQAAHDFAEQQQMRAQAQEAILRARRMFAERERLFASDGSGDLAGRTMADIRTLDTAGTQIIGRILGAGRVPPSQALAAVNRIKEIAHRSLGNGGLAPAGESTAAMRRFEGGEALPAPEIQAIREALFMRIMEPLARRGQGNQVPIQTIINNLDTAINGPGRSITRELFTANEVKEIERFLAALRHYAPTSASRPTGLTAARLLAGSADGLVKFIGGAPGMAIRAIVGIVSPAAREAGGELAAAQTFSRPVLPDGLPRTQSGAAYGQVARDYGDSGQGADAPLEPPPSTARQAYEAGIDMSRPILSNDNGTFSTERTITIEADGVFYNIPTIVNGQQMGVNNALRMWEEGRNPEVGRFGSEAEALEAARRRSEEIGRIRGGEARQ